MHVVNIHERRLQASVQRVGQLLDSLAAPNDGLWPYRCWPRMILDGPLAVGAAGGHGPVRYRVESHTPGRDVRFRFTGPRGFDGYHEYQLITVGTGCVLRHTLRMRAHGPALLSWPLLFRPLHDALVEDSLAQAQAALGEEPDVRRWSAWVRLLRWLMSHGRARRQAAPIRAH